MLKILDLQLKQVTVSHLIPMHILGPSPNGKKANG